VGGTSVANSKLKTSAGVLLFGTLEDKLEKRDIRRLFLTTTMIERFKQWLATKVHPTYQPTEDDIQVLHDKIKLEVQDDFYKKLDVQSLFIDEQPDALAKMLPIINVVVSAITLIVIFVKK